jgi:hypothetical protein
MCGAAKGGSDAAVKSANDNNTEKPTLLSEDGNSGRTDFGCDSCGETLCP